jgi:hypothetical protein
MAEVCCIEIQSGIKGEMLATLLIVGKCVPRWIKERSVVQTVRFIFVYTGKCVVNADHESLKNILNIVHILCSCFTHMSLCIPTTPHQLYIFVQYASTCFG